MSRPHATDGRGAARAGRWRRARKREGAPGTLPTGPAGGLARTGASAWAPRVGALLVGGLLVAACDGGTAPGVNGTAPPTGLCDLPERYTAQGAVPEAIPALTEPTLVSPGQQSYLRDEDRVLGVVIRGEARAYPHNILWSHEVINDRFGDEWVTVSFCPLTGSGLAMDGTVAGRRVEFAVSGLLHANNLVMFDRLTEDLYGPQLSVEGKCQRFAGVAPRLLPVREMSWARWKELHPTTRVVSEATGYGRQYTFYPYGQYDRIDNDELLFPMEVDRTRPIKERVLGIRVGASGGRAHPFGELAGLGRVGALNEELEGRPYVVFYEAAAGESAIAYDPVVNGTRLTFESEGGGWRDAQTGSTWSLAGRATAGPLAGHALDPLPNAYVAFWFAWRHFQPDAEVWSLD